MLLENRLDVSKQPHTVGAVLVGRIGFTDQSYARRARRSRPVAAGRVGDGDQRFPGVSGPVLYRHAGLGALQLLYLFDCPLPQPLAEALKLWCVASRAVSRYLSALLRRRSMMLMARSVMVSGMQSPMPASATIANVANGVGICEGPTQRNAGRPRWWPALSSFRRSSCCSASFFDPQIASASSMNKVGGCPSPMERKMAATVASAVASGLCERAWTTSSARVLPHRFCGEVKTRRGAHSNAGSAWVTAIHSVTAAAACALGKATKRVRASRSSSSSAAPSSSLAASTNSSRPRPAAM